jgi:translation initiation factor 2B subunit (eIF-2B alpha/beta/delta family)
MTPTKFSERKHNLETRREDLILRVHEQNIFISGIYKRIAEVEEQADVSESSSDSLHKLHNDERSIRDTIDFLGMRVAQLDMSFELLAHQQAVLDNGRNRFLQEAEAAENSSA